MPNNLKRIINKTLSYIYCQTFFIYIKSNCTLNVLTLEKSNKISTTTKNFFLHTYEQLEACSDKHFACTECIFEFRKQTTFINLLKL